VGMRLVTVMPAKAGIQEALNELGSPISGE